MKSDIQIARECELKPIEEIAHQLNITDSELEPYGHYIGKVALDRIDPDKVAQSNLILVTAITPTKAGVGKTTVSIGLALGLNKIGKSAAVALREPSLGPCFGMKGGAAGGGYAQVLPMENINLHFTGDFHAITSAHNMITALLDNYIYQNRNSCEGLSEVLWKRVLDVNDRSLRNCITGLGGVGNGVPTETGFDITPASEIMAILCLASDLDDLRRRIDNILLGYTKTKEPFHVKDLGIGGAITILLKDAIKPNLVQTTEGTPAFIHGGPFANIAHGCNSIIATKMAMSCCDYTITEAGFGADLGAEKFLDIKCQVAGITPKLTVIVATLAGLKMHGDVHEKQIYEKDIEGVRKGLANLDRHVHNLHNFGQTVVVAFNRYATDTDEEIEIVRNHCEQVLGCGFAINNAYSEGGKGATELAKLVVKTIEKHPSEPIDHVYQLSEPVKTKVEHIAKRIYGAANVTYSSKAEKKLARIHELNMERYPICIAKTQYSFSADPKGYGDMRGFDMKVEDIVLNSGAEMIVVIMGSIMRMPGLPKEPQAVHMDIVDGQIEGLS
ncbi:formate--tetrahydrofolate ligase [Porphyromonas sp.]|uniref:formate--tetrahydrofolate ligase n=1 Tax=Porphyromonas sp. TaxID=1924944 RepID=UPI003AB6C6EB